MVQEASSTTVVGPRPWQGRWGPDALAGLTVWAVLVPESLAYATIAGAPPVVGLYAAVPALVLYALLGTSRHLVVAPMSATAALSATVVAERAARGGSDPVALTAALAVVVGAVAVVAGLLRLGFVASFISAPVLRGFVIGLALTIIVGQVPALLGIHGGGGNALAKSVHVVSSLGVTHLPTLVVGGATLAGMLVLRRWAPRVPAALVAVVVGTLVAIAFDLADHGVQVVGHVPAGLPRLSVPDVTAGDYGGLTLPAVGVLLVAFVEGLGASATYANRDGYRIDPDRELRAVGAANVGAGLVGGMVVNGSLSKTAVNAGAGARSQLSGVVAAVLTALTLLFLTGAFTSLPEPVLAAVVIVAVIDLVDLRELRQLHTVWTPRLARLYGRAARADLAGAVAALVGVLVLDVLAGLVIGVLLSVLLLVYRASRPHLTVLEREPGPDGRWAEARTPAPGGSVVVVRVEGGLFFANASGVCDAVRDLGERAPVRAVVLDAATMPAVDVTAAEALARLSTDVDRRGVRLWVARTTGQVRDVLARGGAAAVRISRVGLDETVRTAQDPDDEPGAGAATGGR